MTYTPNTWTNGSGTPIDATHLTNIENELVSLDTAIQTKAPLASPALTGAPTAPTATVGDNTTKLATTAFVLANGGTGGAATSISVVPAGNIASTNVGAALNELDAEKAALASPTFTGVPVAPTAAVATNTTQIATTAFVLANGGGGGAPLNSPAFTGTPTAPTAAAATNTTQLATTAFTATAITNATAGLALTSVIIPAMVAPTATDGADGDFWVNYSTNLLYGPKVGGAWPTYRTHVATRIDVYTASSTFYQSVGAVTNEVICIAPGGGGGSGARGTSGTITTGGSGGGGGGFSRYRFQASDLPTSGITVTVTAGGVGGAAQTVNATAGNGANPAGVTDTSFGTYLRAQKGGSGAGGAITGVAATGGTAGLAQTSGGSGANSISTGAGGVAGATASGGVGGGSGGGITATPTASGGGFGTAPNTNAGGTVATFGASGGGVGADGVVYVANSLGGSGAGGGSSTTTAGGAGGNGAIGSGGGGGGASLAGQNSGAGGNGGGGLCVVITEF